MTQSDSRLYRAYYPSPIGLIEIGGSASAVQTLNFVDKRPARSYVIYVLAGAWNGAANKGQ